tara:strand:+ start:253 stop:624 length:372 start_codon:yes stop_codon:yes gene_type:complete
MFNNKLFKNANIFVPGSTSHIIKIRKPTNFSNNFKYTNQKKVNWDPIGITKVKIFYIEDEYFGSDSAFPNGRKLIGPPASRIKEVNQQEAMPYKINLPENIIIQIKNNNLVRQKPLRYNYCDN